ncbi:hypothetical protein CU098_012311 [Rhizopus stolonifer]|uniref:RRM domain-containing protein n=1 Tax=Rhizopus stolonifer TaxID=4846 RepID=A0A367KIP4_RHIST|nr:hypothetical protein CU098_012311 [Rhizopus stolonifer]
MDTKTLLKGYKSLPTNLHIVRIRIEQLPLIHPKLLLEQLKQRLASFGEVLQLGLLKEGQYSVGKGYAYLNLDIDPEPDEALRPIVNWIGDRRRIVLT